MYRRPICNGYRISRFEQGGYSSSDRDLDGWEAGQAVASAWGSISVYGEYANDDGVACGAILGKALVTCRDRRFIPDPRDTAVTSRR
jgi:hypothetical protein